MILTTLALVVIAGIVGTGIGLLLTRDLRARTQALHEQTERVNRYTRLGLVAPSAEVERLQTLIDAGTHAR